MVSRKVQVVNPSGLHLRPAGLLCQTSMKFESKVNILYKDQQINAKSVLNVMASRNPVRNGSGGLLRRKG